MKEQINNHFLVLLFQSQNKVRLVQLNGEKESKMMGRNLIQADKNYEHQLIPCTSKSCATDVGTKIIQDLNILPEDFEVESQQHSEKECDVMVKKPIQADEGTKLQPKYNCGKSSAPHLGGKARRKLNLLTEDEKEERRLRRMLANRESARQAILRRQAHRQELARRAAELERENDNLKKEKEVAMKKYESLKSTNESLKAQLNLHGATVNVEVEETQESLKINNAHIPTPTSTKHENPVRMNVPGPYALPYTWLFPLSYDANGVPPQSLDFASKRFIPKQSSTSPFRKTVADVKKDQRYPLKMVRGGASTSTEIIGPSVEVNCGKTSGKKLAHKHKVTSEGNKETVTGSSVRQRDAIKRKNEFITSVAATSSSSGKNEDRIDGGLLWSEMDDFTAAEARKRRKDVIKMKNFHYSRQSHVKISSV
ncbi:hypothetical protein POM88_017790 [Heracleum sosnowskyi]|uniref:BZIP domain-containing protein n=1 Tax=Heracleum sosnowskyi TaxID=360622 RepID=A0AAD8MYL1_9APIA|nr:hypothetical protein POM88_017790 [Heracleum sosnowskyi]